MYEKNSDQRNNGGIFCLENIGSCGLHTEQKQKENWKLDKVLKSMWKLCQNSPAQRDICVSENKSAIFPMKFCLTYWVENVTGAEQAINSYLIVLIVIKHSKGLAPSKRQ